MNTITRQEAFELIKKAQEEEAKWQKLTILGHDLALLPDGRCHFYEENCTFPSFEEALKEVREDYIRVCSDGIRIYTPIVADYDNGREYDEYFTERRVEYFRNMLVLYPEWIKNVQDGKLLISCEGKDCKSRWVDGYHPENLGTCPICNGNMKYV